MKQRMVDLLWKVRLWHELQGQDLIEYALMTGLVATGLIAMSPQLAASISTQFSKVAVPLSQASTQGS